MVLVQMPSMFLPASSPSSRLAHCSIHFYSLCLFRNDHHGPQPKCIPPRSRCRKIIQYEWGFLYILLLSGVIAREGYYPRDCGVIVSACMHKSTKVAWYCNLTYELFFIFLFFLDRICTPKDN